MCRTQRLFIGLENFFIKSFHIVDGRVKVEVKDKDLDYLSASEEAKHTDHHEARSYLSLKLS